MTALERDPSAAPTAETGGAPLVRVRGLAITHLGESAPVPASVSFDIAPGEVVLLLGPSGSGKSTLTLALNGLIPNALPAEVTGTVEVGGQDAAHTSVAELSTSVGMVFQDPDAQLVTGTLLDEVAFGPENLRMPVPDVLARAESALRRVGLWDRRTENPDRLSGGGRQRLAIACALAMGSALLVLDEPTANLDPRGIESLVRRLPTARFRYAVTGSVAANRLAPVAPARLAMVYVDDPDEVSAELNLTPTETGANVMLLAPFDDVAFARTRVDEGVTYVAPSQSAVDLLTSPGRSPAEGEAVLEWMARNPVS